MFQRFPDDQSASAWFAEVRWGGEPACPNCGSVNVQDGTKHPTMPYWCRFCRKFFSVKTGTAMQSSKLGLQTWAIAIYLLARGLEGQSSMKLHRDLEILQKAAWHLAHQLRKAWDDNRGSLTDKATLKGFVDHTAEDATVHTDDLGAYQGLPIPSTHETVKHSVGEYVRGMAHTSGMESFWSMLKRGHYGTYHRMSPNHLQRYVNEFAGRQTSGHGGRGAGAGRGVRPLPQRARRDSVRSDEGGRDRGRPG